VLLVRAGALGDVLLLRRGVRSLRAAGHDVGLLAPAASAAAIAGPGPSEVGQVVRLDRAEAAPLLTAEGLAPGPLAAELAAFGAAVVFSRSELLARSLKRLVPSVLVRDPVPPPGSGHAADWYAGAVTELAPVVPGPLPTMSPTPDEREAAAAFTAGLPEAFLAVHPGSGAAAKNWPAERFVSLVGLLAGDRPWALLQGPADRVTAAPLRRAAGVIAIADLPVRVLGAVLSGAGLYVGNDSGVTHLAAAYGAPTVALFGPTDPTIWSPLGPRVAVVRSPRGTMDSIEPGDVLAAAASLGVR
jgi:ADP-heptose:LPS heptosyltransferase